MQRSTVSCGVSYNWILPETSTIFQVEILRIRSRKVVIIAQHPRRDIGFPLLSHKEEIPNLLGNSVGSRRRNSYAFDLQAELFFGPGSCVFSRRCGEKFSNASHIWCEDFHGVDACSLGQNTNGICSLLNTTLSIIPLTYKSIRCSYRRITCSSHSKILCTSTVDILILCIIDAEI